MCLVHFDKIVKSKTIFSLFFIFISFIVSSQNETYRFNQSKNLGEHNIIHFKVVGLNNDIDEQNSLLEYLLTDDLIFNGNLYNGETNSVHCQLEIDAKVSVEYLQSILQYLGYDIDQTSLKDPNNNKKPDGIYNAERYSFFETFNGYKDYNPNTSNVSSEEHYANEKDKWIKENPEEYKRLKSQKGNTIVVKRKDLETYTDQKKQEILKNPDKFIIED